MSGNEGLTRPHLPSEDEDEEEEENVWVPQTLFRPQPVDLFSHHATGGGGEKWWENRQSFVSAALRFQAGGS